MTVLWIVLGVLGLAVLAIALSYNRFVRQRNLIRDSWYIDTELRPVDSMDGGGRRGSSDPPGTQAGAENALVGSLRHLLAVAESYPDLKADGAFLSLQDELTNTEDRIQAARRFYNANVRSYNQRVESVPSNAIASLFASGGRRSSRWSRSCASGRPPRLSDVGVS